MRALYIFILGNIAVLIIANTLTVLFGYSDQNYLFVLGGWFVIVWALFLFLGIKSQKKVQRNKLINIDKEKYKIQKEEKLADEKATKIESKITSLDERIEMMSEITEEDWLKAINARKENEISAYHRIMDINTDTPKFKWFSWEARPAVIVINNDGSERGFLVKNGDDSGKWTKASAFEIYDSGREISKADFLEVYKDRLNLKKAEN